jgi:hypothetical protein
MTDIIENWHNLFFNPSILSIDPTMIEIINVNTNNTSDKVEEIEINYFEKIKEITVKYQTTNIISIYSNKKSLEILQVELEIIKLISRYSLQNSTLDYQLIIVCLRYLFKLSEILRQRLKLPIIELSKQNKSSIIRCSYKFCNFKDSCVYNYTKKGHCCYQNHYVHNMVSHDISALIMFIESNNTESEDSNYNKEILKSINTLSFVISHMETELKTKCMYADIKEWDSYHFIHTK